MLALIPGLFAVFAFELLRPGSSTKRTARRAASCGRASVASGGSWRRRRAEDRFDFSGRKELYTAYIPWAVAFGVRRRVGREVPHRDRRGAAGAALLQPGATPACTAGFAASMVDDFSSTVELGDLCLPGHPELVLQRQGAAASPAAAAAAAAAVAPGEPPRSPSRRSSGSSGTTRRNPREIRMIVVIIVVVVVVALVGFGVVGFNKLRTTDIGAQEALGGIDVQLTRRADLIPNLVETVKGYAAHEKGVFEEVTNARARVQQAAARDDVPAKAAADAAAHRRAGQPQRGRRELPRPEGEHRTSSTCRSSSPRPRTRSRSPASTTTTPSPRLNKLDPDHPVDVLHRHRRRAPARVLRRPRGPGPGAAGQLLNRM